ncbi:hypothetical protein BKA70DRAFT_1401688 [Coprinopsis sp. MPI-PUGE-AT-0042]|nr:hypothetical protein BKA70DRAFT_1401688 [Coprinopsis sp. MPI-PUGE-AT-0042]
MNTLEEQLCPWRHPSHLRDQQFPELCVKHNVDCSEPRTNARLLDKLAGEFIKPLCQSPAFIVSHPRVASQVASLASWCERVEGFMCGQAFSHAFTESKDPFEQRLRFEEQILRHCVSPLGSHRNAPLRTTLAVPPLVLRVRPKDPQQQEGPACCYAKRAFQWSGLRWTCTTTREQQRIYHPSFPACYRGAVSGSGKPPGAQLIIGPCAKDGECASGGRGFDTGGAIISLESDGLMWLLTLNDDAPCRLRDQARRSAVARSADRIRHAGFVNV